MSYARARQRSRQQDERLIERDHSDFSYGMARQADIESIDLPKNAAADGVNVRFSKRGWRGRPGTKLYSPADFGVTITDSHDATLSDAILTGEIYEANGNAVPSVGDIFVVYGTGDTTSNALQTAKGYAVRKYDCFKVTNNTIGSVAIRYIGRIGVPAIPGYGELPTEEFTASQATDTITATVGTFDSTHVGSYFNWNDGTRCLIEEYYSDTEVRVTPSQSKSSTAMCYIQPPVNATLYHEAINKTIALFGSRLYVTMQMPFAGWTEISPIGFVPSIRPASTSQCVLLPDGDDAILINPRAWYRIKLTAQPYYYKINAAVPTTVIVDEEVSATAKFKYNYTHSIARLIGSTIMSDRTTDGVTLEHESAPVKPFTGEKDWGYRWADKRVGDGSTTYGKLTGVALAGDYVTQAGWSDISDAEIGIPVSGTTYSVGVDLTGVTDMNDVCKRLQYAARTYHELRDIVFEFVTDHIEVSTGDNDTIEACTDLGGTGTDISAATGLSTGAATTLGRTAALVVYYLTMPKDEDGNVLAEWYHATHYPVYRTGNAADLPEGTEAHDYRWIADIPVAKVFTGSVTDDILTTTEANLEDEDTSAVVFAEDGSYCTISEVTSSTTATVISIKNSAGTTITTISSQSMGIGGGTIFTALQSGTGIYVVSGYSLSDADIGKQIFWSDGYISVIKSVTDTSNAVALTTAEHSSQAATCDPVSRVFSDTISDDNIRQDYARYTGWPLRIRYQDAMPAGGLGAIVPGYVFSAQQGTSSFAYCTRLWKWHVGYGNPGYQIYDRIIDGIQHFKTKDAALLIYGSRRRYYIDTTYGTEVGETRVGESVTKLQDPIVQSNAVGTAPSSGAQELENGSEILVTQEPAVRIISTSSESENYAEARIQKSDLQKMKNVFVGAYNAICGWFLWGKQEI